MSELIVGVLCLGAGWLVRGWAMYNKAKKNAPFTNLEAARLILRGGRA